MINSKISSLVNFYLENEIIQKEDVNYLANKIIHLINLEEFQFDKTVESNLYDSLNDIIQYAVDNKLIDDIPSSRESFEAQLTDIIVPIPSVLNNRVSVDGFKNYVDEFYKLCELTNYIKANDLAKNHKFKYNGSKGVLNLTINLAKPEKDPREIALLKTVKSNNYPKCLLCTQNIGYYGNVTKPARSNLRTLNLELGDSGWQFQYSPYLYFDRHCIILSNDHVDMKTNEKTVVNQIDFVDQLPDFFIGNNADISIVGGSILDHNHYQGGRDHFPIEDSKVLKVFDVDGVSVEYLDWYLQTVKIVSKDKNKVINIVNKINENFKEYENEKYNIFNKNNNNAINIITRIKDGNYNVYVMFRNNATTRELPFGIYHPNESLHHIKKENIGLIEAMGLAILPGRLQKELIEIKYFIQGKDSNVVEMHKDYANELKVKYDESDINSFIENAVGSKFEQVLECCDVFRYFNTTDEKIEAIEYIVGGLK